MAIRAPHLSSGGGHIDRLAGGLYASRSRNRLRECLGDWALIERRAHSLRPRYAVILCLAMLCVGAARRLRDLRWRALGPRHKSRQRVQRCLAHSSYRRLGHYSSPSLGSGLQGRADATSRTCVVNERSRLPSKCQRSRSTKRVWCGVSHQGFVHASVQPLVGVGSVHAFGFWLLFLILAC